MKRISYTLNMMRSSWEVLKAEKQLMLFPLISGVCCLLVLLSFGLPLWANGFPNPEQWRQRPLLYYGLLFLFYFMNYFIVVFFNSAVIACAILRMRGGEPTLSTGIHAALSRLPQILGWALVAASVGLILRALENLARRRGNWVGQIVAGLLGMAWSVVTFLVVPILVVEKKGPFEAVKESAALLRKTWGEQLVGNFGFGLVFFLLALASLVPLLLGFLIVHAAMPLGVLLIAIGLIYLIGLAVVQSTLQTIFQAAVYLYARDNRAPKGFDESDLSSAMAPSPRPSE
jgi:cytochrome c biogenesis protein CcdA